MNRIEFEIPVPWGHIAAKTWGDAENTPVLVVHGIGDNAGSFDRMLPYLPTSFYYICIDLPSHGKSSHYPPHLITIFDHIYALKLLVDYFDRKEYILMGHSWGGQTIVIFTQLYPEHALKLIVLEAFYLFPTPVDDLKSYLNEKFNVWIKINEKMTLNKQPLLYTYEEAIIKLTNKRRFGKLTRESAKALLKRSLIPVGKKFRFSNDPHLRSAVNPLIDMKFIEGLIKKYPITCPALFVYVPDSEWLQQYNFKKVVEELRKTNNCVIKKVAGDHGVHTNNPEIVGPIVTEFLSDMKSKL